MLISALMSKSPAASQRIRDIELLGHGYRIKTSVIFSVQVV